MEEPADMPVEIVSAATGGLTAQLTSPAGGSITEPPLVPASAAEFSKDWVRQVMEDWFRRNEMSPEKVTIRNRREVVIFILRSSCVSL